MKQAGSFVNAAPVIALYAFAGYRMMPAMQQIYIAFSSLRFVRPSLDFMYSEMKNSSISEPNNTLAELVFEKASL